MATHNSFQKWQARLRFIHEEYPFGPIKKYHNDDGRLHRDNGPAYISPTRCCWYENGQKHGLDVSIFGTLCYYFHGIVVPRHFVTRPETLTVKEVISHTNAEVRYAGIRIIGYENIRDSQYAEVIHSDKENDRELIEISGIFSKPYRVVKVLNAHPEPDGSTKIYFLNVPPDIETCQQAVAWTFGMKEDEYRPEIET